MSWMVTAAGPEGQRTVLLGLPTATAVHWYGDSDFCRLDPGKYFIQCWLHIEYGETVLVLFVRGETGGIIWMNGIWYMLADKTKGLNCREKVESPGCGLHGDDTSGRGGMRTTLRYQNE